MPVAQRTYARALFEAGKEQERLERVHEDVSDFVVAVEEVPELAALLENPEIDRSAKAAVLGELQGIMWLGFALTEAVVFYGLVGGFLGLVLV